LTILLFDVLLLQLLQNMGHKKLIRFAEMETFPNVFQNNPIYKGKWSNYFANNNDIILELACGKGEYSIGLAQLYTGKNCIGVDIKGNRIWVGAKKCIKENINNVAFLRTQIDGIQNYFAPNEVSEIWITFPDPQLRWSKMNKRLTHPKYLNFYKTFLKPQGIIHLKTDSPDLYHFTKKVIELNNLEVITDYDDVYAVNNLSEALKIKTHYEGLNISGSNKIFYLSFKIDAVKMGTDKELKAFFKPDTLL
jgi:tRNA (guanine-N7-)-methyltransferase